MEWTFSLPTIRDVAQKVWAITGPGQVLAFHGSMGAGKTTFIHALCDVLKVQGAVGSPTFALINEYRYAQGPLFHIDLYRIQSEDEAVRAGIEEALHSGHSCFIEWPEKAPHLLPEATIHLYLEVLDEQTRTLRIGGN